VACKNTENTSSQSNGHLNIGPDSVFKKIIPALSLPLIVLSETLFQLF